ncbi:MAG TPA: glucosamine-6-phosphate deaminase [Vicinamibacteria bacterium]|nr:glucosamine-6-phosphate deaminase [Vicinamibacteria bacterium]
MQIVIQKEANAAALLVARVIAQEIRRNPSCVLGLATGRTMEELYEHLVREHREHGLDFSLCRTFNLDEYIGLPPENPNSYRAYMNRHFFSRVNVDIRNTHVPNGMAADLDGECARYEGLIRKHGGIDLQLLGLGRAGHIGFNEPLSALRSMTRVKALTPETISQNSPLFDDGTPMPRHAITMGVGTILECKRLVMLATGSEKADILHKAVEGPITSMVTASALQLHPHCTVVVDEEAGKKLEEKEYYRWIFENEPEWAELRPHGD